eukprot:COSAG05_NODE_163_length_15471_cov_29.575072_2_plen_81_part_00
MSPSGKRVLGSSECCPSGSLSCRANQPQNTSELSAGNLPLLISHFTGFAAGFTVTVFQRMIGRLPMKRCACFESFLAVAR